MLVGGEQKAGVPRANAVLLVCGLDSAIAGCLAAVVLRLVSNHWWVKMDSKASAGSLEGKDGSQYLWLQVAGRSWSWCWPASGQG